MRRLASSNAPWLDCRPHIGLHANKVLESWYTGSGRSLGPALHAAPGLTSVCCSPRLARRPKQLMRPIYHGAAVTVPQTAVTWPSLLFMLSDAKPPAFSFGEAQRGEKLWSRVAEVGGHCLPSLSLQMCHPAAFYSSHRVPALI